MKVEVSVLGKYRVLVVFTPSLLDRILGEKIEERVAISLPTLPSGSRAWHYEAKGTPVPRRIALMISDAFVDREWDVIWAKRPAP